MSWVAAAVVGGAVIGGGAAILSSSQQAGAASDASKASADAARYQTDVQKQVYDQTRADETPWREAGAGALSQLQGLTGPNGELLQSFSYSPFSFQADPGYAFRQAEGMKSIERSAAARGGALSGGAVRSAERFGQGLASDEYARAYDRYGQDYTRAFNTFNTNQSNKFNRLASLAGVGQTANAALQQAGSTYANATTGISQADATNQGNAILAAGNARASGYLGAGNAVGNALASYPYLAKRPTPPATDGSAWI